MLPITTFPIYAVKCDEFKNSYFFRATTTHYFKNSQEAAAFALDKKGKVIPGIYAYAFVDKDEKTYLLEPAYKHCEKYKMTFEWKNEEQKNSIKANQCYPVIVLRTETFGSDRCKQTIRMAESRDRDIHFLHAEWDEKRDDEWVCVKRGAKIKCDSYAAVLLQRKLNDVEENVKAIRDQLTASQTKANELIMDLARLQHTTGLRNMPGLGNMPVFKM